MDLERHSTRWSGVSLALVLLRTTVLESLLLGRGLKRLSYLAQGPGFANQVRASSDVGRFGGDLPSPSIGVFICGSPVCDFICILADVSTQEGRKVLRELHAYVCKSLYLRVPAACMSLPPNSALRFDSVRMPPPPPNKASLSRNGSVYCRQTG